MYRNEMSLVYKLIKLTSFRNLPISSHRGCVLRDASFGKFPCLDGVLFLFLNVNKLKHWLLLGKSFVK